MDALKIKSALANITARAQELIEKDDPNLQTTGYRIKDAAEDITKEFEKGEQQ